MANPKARTLDRNVIDKLIAAAPVEYHVLLYGWRGTGKSSVARAACAKTPYTLTLTAEQSAASLLGHFIPKGGEFVFHYGPLSRAMKEGRPIIINEIDHASEDVSNILHFALDEGEAATLTLPNGETITPAPGYRVFATMNGQPSDLAPAVRDRLKCVIAVNAPSQAQLDRLSKPLQAIAADAYRNAKAETGPTVTYRMLLALATLQATLPLEQAVVMATGDLAVAQGLLDTLAVLSPSV
jgi:MoxR-like ATPase